MSKVFFLIVCFCFVFSKIIVAQSTNIPLNKDTYHLIDRLEILSGEFTPNHHSAVKPYTRKAIGQFSDSIKQQFFKKSKQDNFNLDYLRNDNWEWVDTSANKSKRPFLKYFYQKKSDFLYKKTKKKAIQFHLNPVLYLSYGGETEQTAYTYINTRGLQLRGMIDEKVGFYVFMSENQARFPMYVQNFVKKNNVIPGEGFWKSFGTNGYDFFNTTGYISFNVTKHINFQFGHDRQFIGDGYRSMLISNFSPPAFFLKINTHVWNLNYSNLFTQIFADAFGNATGSTGNSLFPKKFMVAHRLGINIGRHVNLGVFEAIIFGRKNNRFELSYLNPIIFYRSLEQQNGSLDNGMIAFDAKWNFLNHFSIYGQFIFDEFKISALKNNNGWWSNKYGYQLGLKYINVLTLNNLDLQLEYNSARPYTYSHSTIYSNYANYKQAIAHPLGANFKETIGIIRYQPITKLNLTAKFIYAKYGLDSNNKNWGKDILKDYSTHEQEYGNYTGQGIASTLVFASFTTTYQLKHNVFVDLKIIAREQKSDNLIKAKKSTIYSFAFRWNIAQRLQAF